MGESQLTGAVVVSAQKIFSESSTQLHGIGECVFSNDGRGFKYCKVGTTALVPGKLYQAPAEDTTNFQDLTVTAPSAGDTSITTTSTVTLTANQLAGGSLVITSATTNAGQILRVASHAAASGAVVTFNLDDPVVYAPTGTTKVDVHPNPFNAVIVHPTTQSSAPKGVALYKVTAAYFGWLQVCGQAPVLADGGITVGDPVVASDNTDGAVEVIADGAAELLPRVGNALTGIATTEYGLIDLHLL